jgi:hypothetical protein
MSNANNIPARSIDRLMTDVTRAASEFIANPNCPFARAQLSGLVATLSETVGVLDQHVFRLQCALRSGSHA